MAKIKIDSGEPLVNRMKM